MEIERVEGMGSHFEVIPSKKGKYRTRLSRVVKAATNPMGICRAQEMSKLQGTE